MLGPRKWRTWCQDFLKNSFTGLMRLSVEALGCGARLFLWQELRNPLSICFKNEARACPLAGCRQLPLLSAARLR